MLAMMRTSPPQSLQVSISIWNTRFSRCAQVIDVRYLLFGAKQAFPNLGQVPEVLQIRLISVRAFDEKHFMVNADVADGLRLHEVIPAMFKDPAVAYLHLHNAKPGCFAARVTRA